MTDDELDLTWYFQNCDGDCGARSPLGHQLETLRLGLPLSSGYPDSEVSERVLVSSVRSRAIYARLRAMPSRQVRVLELQYGDPVVLSSGVSVALAAAVAATVSRPRKRIGIGNRALVLLLATRASCGDTWARSSLLVVENRALVHWKRAIAEYGGKV